MAFTGKYDFKGIQKAGALGIKALLASTSWGLSIIKGPFGWAVDRVSKLVTNWLANRGLVILNIGKYWMDGEFDQGGFDKALDEGISKTLKKKVDKATGESIDEKVRKAARKFFKYNKLK